MTSEDIQALFTRSDGTYAFARWGRPISPIVFGVEEETLRTVKGAWEAVATLVGHSLAETDPELGANAMMFFFRDWAELRDVPDLDRLIPELGALVTRLEAAQANQYRAFRFDDTGAIQAVFVFLRMDSELAEMSAQVLALSQVVQAILLWSEAAFAERSPLAVADDTIVLRPEIGDLIRAAYDPVLPASAGDAAHALRLFARLATG